MGNGDQTFNEVMHGFYFDTRDDEDLNLTVDTKIGVVRPFARVETTSHGSSRFPPAPRLGRSWAPH